MLEIKSLI